MDQLSMEARIALRKAGMGKLSYLPDKVLEKSGGSVDMTRAEICQTTGLNRSFINQSLKSPKVTLPETTRKAENDSLDHMFTFATIEGIMYSYNSKTEHMPRQYESTCFHLPSSEEIDKALGIEYPTYMRVRLDTYQRYKADITQYLTVKEPGRHSYDEIARAAGVSTFTVRRHEEQAGTKVVRHFARVPLAQWDAESIPEDYFDYVKNDKKYKFRGAWLEYKGIKEPYAKTGYQKPLLRGGTKDTIEVVWNKRGDHFARESLKMEQPVTEEEQRKFASLSRSVEAGKITVENFKEFFPDVLVAGNLRPSRDSSFVRGPAACHRWAQRFP